MNQKTKDALVLGFALFAVFFGAGNLIFPPLIGVVSGSAYEGRRGIPVAGRTGGDGTLILRFSGGEAYPMLQESEEQ